MQKQQEKLHVAEQKFRMRSRWSRDLKKQGKSPTHEWDKTSVETFP